MVDIAARLRSDLTDALDRMLREAVADGLAIHFVAPQFEVDVAWGRATATVSFRLTAPGSVTLPSGDVRRIPVAGKVE